MKKNRRIHAVIVAAGRSTRMGGGVSKVFLPLEGEPVLRRSVRAFEKLPGIVSVTVVVRPGEEEKAADALEGLPVRIVPGGEERLDSVKNGVGTITDSREGDLLAIHDGARPFVTPEIITAALEGVSPGVGAVPAVPVKDTIKVATREGLVETTPDRARLYAVQTPQCFRLKEFRAALQRAPAGVTDDAGAFEAAGYAVRLTQGDYNNIKITTPSDLPLAQTILAEGQE